MHSAIGQGYFCTSPSDLGLCTWLCYGPLVHRPGRYLCPCSCNACCPSSGDILDVDDRVTRVSGSQFSTFSAARCHRDLQVSAGCWEHSSFPGQRFLLQVGPSKLEQMVGEAGGPLRNIPGWEPGRVGEEPGPKPDPLVNHLKILPLPQFPLNSLLRAIRHRCSPLRGLASNEALGKIKWRQAFQPARPSV